MDDRDLDRLADGWLAAATTHLRAMAGGVEPLDRLWWAFERTDELIDEAPHDGLRLICRILERCDLHDTTLGALAAGPLERLLVDHGPAVIARVEDEARRSIAFAALLGGVRRSAIEEAVWMRVQAVRDTTAPGTWLH